MSSERQFSNLNITSIQNQKIKYVLQLRDRRYRDRYEKTLVEGYRELRLAVSNKFYPDSLFFCPSLFLGKNEFSLLTEAQIAGVKLISTSEKVFRKISYRDRPDGLLGVSAKIGVPLDTLKLKSEIPLILVVESVEKPGNLGSILRSADGAGLDAVIVCDPKTDINNPNVVRASVGTLFSMPVVEADGEAILDYLRIKDFHIILTSPEAKKVYWDADLSQPTAIVVGSEQYGLSELWSNIPAEKVCIPMHGAADSLNVSTASTILMYEAVRQRRR